MEKLINSWDDLQKDVPRIITSLNKDENLKIACATNPILAIEELGYKIKPDVVDHLEDRIRFRPEQVEQLSVLRESIHKFAGKNFNIRSQVELNAVLFEDLKIESYDQNGCIIKKWFYNRKKGDTKDDLKLYKDLHPIIEPLLKFREIDSTVAGFSDKSTYLKIRKGKYGDNSNIKLSIRLKKHLG